MIIFHCIIFCNNKQSEYYPCHHNRLVYYNDKLYNTHIMILGVKMISKKLDTVVANEKINNRKLVRAKKIILDLYQELPKYIAKGYGPFLAAIYDTDGHLIAKAANTVLRDKCSHDHAEINAIRKAERILKTHDLSSHNLSLYVTAEPCMMCLGAIMWAGINAVYYGVPSASVESITGFDEGFKQNWLQEFKRRKITVYGNIEPEYGEQILHEYIKQNRIVYKPKRK